MILTKLEMQMLLVYGGIVIYLLCLGYTAWALVRNFKKKKWFTGGDLVNVVIGSIFWPIVWLVVICTAIVTAKIWDKKLWSAADDPTT